MNEGDVILTPLPQADGKVKNRPAVILRKMPVFGHFLVCGVSTQSSHLAPDFDERISNQDNDFKDSGLIADSIIRLGFLAILPSKSIIGSIGVISSERHHRLLDRLSDYLTAYKRTSS